MNKFNPFKKNVIVDFEGKTDVYSPVVFKKHFTGLDLTKTWNPQTGEYEFFIIAHIPKGFIMTKIITIIHKSFGLFWTPCRLVFRRSDSSLMLFYDDLKYVGVNVHTNMNDKWVFYNDCALVGQIDGSVAQMDGEATIIIEGFLANNKLASYTSYDKTMMTKLKSSNWEEREIITDFGVELDTYMSMAVPENPNEGDEENKESEENSGENADNSGDGKDDGGSIEPVPIDDIETPGGK